MTDAHDHERLTAYAVGLLPEHDQPALTRHLDGCQACQAELSELRAMDAALQAMPPELFLDGPPPNSDWVLRRATRQLRRESEQRQRHGLQRRRRRTAIAAAALIALTGSLGAAAGYALHQPPTPTSNAVAAPATPVAGTRTLTGLNTSSGARIDVTLTPNTGWVGIKANIVGLPPHERCMLVVTDNKANRYIVGSWAVPDPSEGSNHYTVDAGAAVPLTDVSTITVESLDNQLLIKALA
ncbi:anti-sigma factor family protein [Pseudonocardia acaciae]|uniref:anti-sigma factor family protein n=1 Tax=Pseudonocardia acaciae TaxID=551276 RepID=UPI00048F41DF|nr:hypothetical protein [Pseudonocardia acaciae]